MAELYPVGVGSGIDRDVGQHANLGGTVHVIGMRVGVDKSGERSAELLDPCTHTPSVGEQHRRIDHDDAVRCVNEMSVAKKAWAATGDGRDVHMPMICGGGQKGKA